MAAALAAAAGAAVDSLAFPPVSAFVPVTPLHPMDSLPPRLSPEKEYLTLFATREPAYPTTPAAEHAQQQRPARTPVSKAAVTPAPGGINAATPGRRPLGGVAEGTPGSDLRVRLAVASVTQRVLNNAEGSRSTPGRGAAARVPTNRTPRVRV